MTDLEDIDRRLRAVEEWLRMDGEPPDRLSLIDQRLDSMWRVLLDVNLAQDLHSRQIVDLRAGVRTAQADLHEVKAGVGTPEGFTGRAERGQDV